MVMAVTVTVIMIVRIFMRLDARDILQGVCPHNGHERFLLYPAGDFGYFDNENYELP